VREPDQLGVDRAHQPLALRLWVVEVAVRDRGIADEDDRARVRLDDDDL
jgi:hypothetical protein